MLKLEIQDNQDLIDAMQALQLSPPDTAVRIYFRGEMLDAYSEKTGKYTLKNEPCETVLAKLGELL